MSASHNTYGLFEFDRDGGCFLRSRERALHQKLLALRVVFLFSHVVSTTVFQGIDVSLTQELLRWHRQRCFK